MILGAIRWMIAGKKPSMFEKWCGAVWGTGLNCLFVIWASSRAVKRPAIVTIRALSFKSGCIVMMGVLRGRVFEVMRRPAIMLPHARRLMGLIVVGSFSLIGESGANRGCPIDTKNTTRRL